MVDKQDDESQSQTDTIETDDSNQDSTDQDKEPDLAARLTNLEEALTVKTTELEKAARDNGSLRAQIVPQTERDAEHRGDMASINKRLDLISGAISSDDATELPNKIAQLDREDSQRRGATQYASEYNRLTEEFKALNVDENGEQLFDPVSAPELATVREYWIPGRDRTDAFGRQLTSTESSALLSRAMGELAKATALETIKRAKSATASEKSKREADRKKSRDESDELNLDTGSGAGAGGDLYEGMSGTDIVNIGLAKQKKGETKSPVFGG